MASLSDLQTHLNHYDALPHHQDELLTQKLYEVQAWQRARIKQTHQQLFNQPKNHLMADYFVNKLYGGEEFGVLAEQLKRILPKAQKLEKLAPAAALETGTLALHAAIVATELDLHLAQWLLANNMPVNKANMLAAYLHVNEEDERRRQLESLKEVCYRTDKYIKSFMLQKAFAMAKGTAYKYNYHPLYDFIAEGFAAMKPLKQVSDFIEPVCLREMQIIDNVHNTNNHGKIDPFAV